MNSEAKIQKLSLLQNILLGVLICVFPFSTLAEGNQEAERLRNAISSRDIPEIERLIASGMDLLTFDGEFSAIHLATSNDDAEVVALLLEAGVPIDFRTRQAWEAPLLMHAASNNATKTISFLLERGADINVGDRCSDPPIAAAAYFGHLEAVELLIAMGADVTTRSSDGSVCAVGSSAMSYAQDQGHSDIVDVLRKAGAVE